jgi:hypothetical protein
MMNNERQSLYQIAGEEMRRCIDAYIELTKETDALTHLSPDHFHDEAKKAILLAGVGANPDGLSDGQALLEWRRRAAIPFDIEAGVSYGVYKLARRRGDALFDFARRETDDFTRFDVSFVQDNPHLLPLWQHLAGIFSKAALKKHVGAASDSGFSRPAARRLVRLLEQRVVSGTVNKGEILQRLESRWRES